MSETKALQKSEVGMRKSERKGSRIPDPKPGLYYVGPAGQVTPVPATLVAPALLQLLRQAVR